VALRTNRTPSGTGFLERNNPKCLELIACRVRAFTEERCFRSAFFDRQVTKAVVEPFTQKQPLRATLLFDPGFPHHVSPYQCCTGTNCPRSSV
jgi:hypothetical protein